LFGVVVLWIGGKKITQRRRAHRDGAETEQDEAEEMTSPPVFPFAVFPVVFPCLYYLTHADLRYRHPIDPIVCVLAAMAVVAACDFFIKPRPHENP
jgi:hypothetical protein